MIPEQKLARMEEIVAMNDWLEWGNLFDMREDLAEVLVAFRHMRQRLTDLAVEQLDDVTSAYHDGAKDMQDKCLQAVERCHDAGAAGIIRAIPLPDRIISLL